MSGRRKHSLTNQLRPRSPDIHEAPPRQRLQDAPFKPEAPRVADRIRGVLLGAEGGQDEAEARGRDAALSAAPAEDCACSQVRV